MLDPGPSRLLRATWILGHAAAMVSLLLSGFPTWVCALVSILLLGHGALRLPRRSPVTVLRSGGVWSVPAWGLAGLRAAPGSVRTPWVVRVILDSPAGRCVLVLTRDSLTAGQWRRLQVLLRS